MNIRGFASALGLCFAISANAQWTVVNLHPAGAEDSRALDVNGGQQVGRAIVNGVYRACVWSGTANSRVDLHPEGAADSYARGVAGGKQSGGAFRRAALWSGTANSRVDLHPSGATVSYAFGMGGNQQVGYTLRDDIYRASLWYGTAASHVELHPPGASYSFADDVSGGQQVGAVYFEDGVYRASLWTGTAASWVDLTPAGATYSIAEGVSGGQQVGWATLGGVGRASMWNGTAASWVDLHPAGATWSYAWGVGGGHQVGGAQVGGVYRASLWSGTAASWVDLHAYLPGNFTLSGARGIWCDANGTYVVGEGFNETLGRNEALMWVGPPPPPNNFWLNLNKARVAGQNSVLGAIWVGETSPTNSVFTTYDNSSLVTTPPSVTVLAGQLSRNFQITVTAITSTVVTTIFARHGTLTRSQTLTLTPLIPTSLVFTPNPVIGGNTTSCRVVINGVAGPGGRVIAIFDNSAYSTTPNTVTVPAGATQVIFPITTIPVTSTKIVTVTARVSAGEKTGTFRINP